VGSNLNISDPVILKPLLLITLPLYFQMEGSQIS